MALAVAHTTPAASDPTSPYFSPTGITAWDGTGAHTLSGIAAPSQGGTGIAFFTAAGPTVARTYTFPDANATMVYGLGSTTDNAIARMDGTSGAALQGYSSNTPTIGDSGIPTFPAMVSGGATQSAFIVATSAGVQSALAGLVYNSAYSGGAAGGVSRAALVGTEVGIISDVNKTHNTGSFSNLVSNVTYTPVAGGGTDNDITGSKSKVEIAGAEAFRFGTARDTYLAHGGTGSYHALIAESHIAETYGDSDGSIGIVGATFTATQRGTSGTPSVPVIVCAQVDGEDGGTRILRGTVSSYYRGLNVINLHTDGNGSNAPTVAARAGIYIDVMDGTVTGDDFAFRSAATQAMSVRGRIAQGGTATAYAPSFNMSFVKEVAATIGVEASTTSETVGSGITISGGRATAGGSSRAGGGLTLATGVSTGGGSSTMSFFTYTNTAATTSDNSAVEALRLAANGLATRWAGLTVVGMGLPAIVSATRITAQSSNATVTTHTPATDGLYEIAAFMFVSAVTALATTLTCTYTDEAGNARSMIFPVQQLSGSFIAAGAITGTGVWETPTMTIRAQAGAAISIITSAGTFTGVTYTAQGSIKRLAA